MPQYHYSSLSQGPGRIRLLRLLPSESIETEIQCELLEYNLQKSSYGAHLYEALSYTWGDSEKPRSISVNKQTLAITENLHAVLLRLRDHSFERILWIDAVCINQQDLKEQGQQVQLMARIYSQAARVLVWLGETAGNSDTALEGIRVAAESESTDSLNDERIWVLQEVAAARHILIMCGSMVIDGYAFYLGVNRFYEARPDLESSTRPITYLIRGANLRTKHVMSSSGRSSLNIGPLGELIDMFHAHKATMPVDMVYALLGMSSDDPGTAGLLPDYEVPWEKLFKNLLRFLLPKQVYVKTRGDKKTAEIKSKGYILGRVSSVESGAEYKIDVVSSKTLEIEEKRHFIWTLQASAKRVRKGDIVCRLEGAPNPMIIRPCKDYFTVIRIAAFPEGKQTGSGDIKWSSLLRSTADFPRDLLLIWDWEDSLEMVEDQEEYKTWVRANNWVSEYSKSEHEDSLDRATRIWNVAMILDDVGDTKAEERLREGIKGYEMAFEIEHRQTLESQKGRTPLSWAAGNGSRTVLDRLLAKDGVNPDLKDILSRRTPLSWAAGEGQEAAVQLLLETGKVDVNSKDKDDVTPLLWAVFGGHVTVVKLLLETGKIDVESKDKNDLTPLLFAAINGYDAVAKLLLEIGQADVDLKDNYGCTPLSYAASNGHEAIVKLFLDTGRVDVDSKDVNDDTPLSIATSSGYETIVDLLRNYKLEQERIKMITE
ncbi:hypothetical protein EG329_012330 [Mollisiaceae sp. DMI_Dod_QoI]|nr:hypothetical protein EG329_012330 [Helotiales sp. DMI_Dod_QoI]